MPGEASYGPVVFSDPGTQGTMAGDSGDTGTLGRRVFPVLDALLYLADLTTTLTYVGLMFAHAEDQAVKARDLPYVAWAATLLAVYVVAGVVLNFVAAFTRDDAAGGWGGTVLRVLKCCIPEYRVVAAHVGHLRNAGDAADDDPVEEAAQTRLLQSLLQTLPLAALQAFYITEDTAFKDHIFSKGLPVTSVAVSLVNAATAYAFYIVYKHHDQKRKYPRFWQSLLVMLAALVLSGGRVVVLGVMGSVYQVWLSFLAFITVYLLIFTWWTVEVWRRDGSWGHQVLTRLAFSYLESYMVATSALYTALLSLPYVGLSIMYIIFVHELAVDWVFFGVSVGSQVLGVVLVLPCGAIYRTAHDVIIKTLLPPKPENIEPVRPT